MEWKQEQMIVELIKQTAATSDAKTDAVKASVEVTNANVVDLKADVKNLDGKVETIHSELGMKADKAIVKDLANRVVSLETDKEKKEAVKKSWLNAGKWASRDGIIVASVIGSLASGALNAFFLVLHFLTRH